MVPSVLVPYLSGDEPVKVHMIRKIAVGSIDANRADRSSSCERPVIRQHRGVVRVAFLQLTEIVLASLLRLLLV